MTYTPRLTARAHQAEALGLARQRDSFALLMEMGTGKSKVIVDEFGETFAAGESRDLLIIAPAGAYRNWWRESDEDPGELQKHLDPDVYDRALILPWLSGAGKRHRSKLDDFLAMRDRGRPRVMVVNVEALSTVRAARSACETFLSAGRNPIIAVDESTTIKGHNSQRTKFCFKLSDMAWRRRILTGLVTPRDPLDLWAQFYFLDWRILKSRSFYGFRSRYAIMRPMQFGGRTVKIVVGFRDIEELHGLIAPYSYRKTIRECLDLPPTVDLEREVSLTDEQRRAYVDMAERATTQLDSGAHVTATQVITQILRLDQVLCGHVVDEEGNIHDIPETRSSEVIKILNEHSGKAIIWTAYDRCVRKLRAAISKEFGEEAVACFWGANKTTRHIDEQRFKTDPACRFMIATPSAGGRGNTWIVANLAIYHSHTDDLEYWEQSRARPFRDGQTQTVTYVSLVAPGTVDEKKLKNLRRKRSLADVIQGDTDLRSWFQTKGEVS